MKNLSFFVSAFALFTSTSYAAINCGTLPTCDSLGYTDTVVNCPNLNKVIKCPFDTAKGKCFYDASIGTVKYSLYPYDHDGWLLCDGRKLKQTDYPDLYGIIGQKFCSKFTAKNQQAYSSNMGSYVGGKCSTGNFALPDYRGFYLRSMMTSRTQSDTIGSSKSDWYSDALYYMDGAVNEWSLYHTETTPMFARLPNLWGKFTSDRNDAELNVGGYTQKLLQGAFTNPIEFKNYATGNDGWGYLVEFNAEAYNPIYSRTSPYVIPASYGIYTFIYAGKK